MYLLYIKLNAIVKHFYLNKCKIIKIIKKILNCVYIYVGRKEEKKVLIYRRV